MLNFTALRRMAWGVHAAPADQPTVMEATMRVLRLAILALVLSFSVLGTAWASGDFADADLTQVPEPSSLVLLLTGIGAGVAVFFRRRK
jgi:hypothetical protein